MDAHPPAVRFAKLEALGNDFVLIELSETQANPLTPDLQRLADRRYGIGCDQILCLRRRAQADTLAFDLRIFNADGSEAEQCGNGLRAIACWLAQTHRQAQPSGPWTIYSAAGVSELRGLPNGQWQASLPGLRLLDITPVGLSWPDLHAQLVELGNPHLVLIGSQTPSPERCQQLAEQVANSGLFPAGINVGLAQWLGPDTLQLQVHERGAGLTPACGSGAAACAVAAAKQKGQAPPLRVRQPGGELVINWQGDLSQDLTLTGPARLVFHGQLTWLELPHRTPPN